MVRDRILIVDDEKSILDVLGEYLTGQGYECRLCQSPIEALDCLTKDSFAVVLIDLNMPEMNGIELVQHAKEIEPDLGIIVETAVMDVTKAVQAMRAGADDYVLKPFNLTEISLAVANALHKRALTIENRSYQNELESRVHIAAEDLEHVNRELGATKQYLENLLNSTLDTILTVGNDDTIDFVNQGAQQMLGCTEKELIGAYAGDFFAGGPDEVSHIRRLLRKENRLQNHETSLKHKDGSCVPVSISFSRVRDADEKLVSLLAICKDITEQKRLEQELKEMSIRDSLTGLYNQRYFYDRLAAEIERARRQEHPLSLVLFDIDQFKAYNDGHGHLEGDKVLQITGKVVHECTRGHVDVGFRYGGDEFTVILPEADEKQALSIAERIRKSFKAKHFDHLTVSIGLLAYRDGYSVQTFIQFADAMMYDAKRSGGNRVFVYRPEVGLREGDRVR